ncbi:EF-hand calcium-binding domain-containing protein 4B [Cichlidogyrus casuarinus]|uniref:EF-hand calcium-binding domain-containing protein 4B n=1 Tax=Cichlidogyrus casuarinus TaxID=1844966 RepID=A0ABD2QNV2_9PLAT
MSNSIQEALAKNLFEACYEEVGKELADGCPKYVTLQELRTLLKSPTLGSNDKLIVNPFASLEEEQLNVIFSSLDLDNNGQLSEAEFVKGFSDHMIEKEQNDSVVFNACLEVDTPTELVDNLSDYVDKDTLERLLSVGNPETRDRLTKLMKTLEQTIDKQQKECANIESCLQSTIREEQEELNKVYSELDEKMTKVTESQLNEVKERDKELLTKISNEIAEKQLLINELENKTKDVQSRVLELEMEHTLTRNELFDVLADKNKLEEAYDESRLWLQESKESMNELQKKTKTSEARSETWSKVLDLKLNEEYEVLLTELEELRAEHRRLQDMRDENYAGLGVVDTPLFESNTRPPIEFETDECIVNMVEGGPQLMTGCKTKSLTNRQRQMLGRKSNRGSDSSVDSVPVKEQPLDPIKGIYRVLVLGDKGSGKTSLIRSLCGSTSCTESGESKTVVNKRIDNFMLQLWDSASGQKCEKYDGIVVISRNNNFQSWDKWLKANMSALSEAQKPVIMTLQNKDNAHEPGEEQQERQVGNKEEMLHFQTNTESGQNVHKAFKVLAKWVSTSCSIYFD